MINASQEFKNKVNNGAKFVNYADITLGNGTVLNLTPSDFAVGGFSMSDEMTDGKFGIGFAIGKTINVTIANHTNKFSTYDFYKSIIYMYVAIEMEDGRVLKERKGKYYVINPTSPGDVIKLSGVDSMHLLDKPYDAKTAYPATLQSILSDCCLDCGINIGFGQFDKYNFVVNNRPEDATYRDVVSYVAQIAGYNARISNNDALELIWYDTSHINTSILDGGKLYFYDEADTYDGGDFSNYDAAILFDGGNFTDTSPENVTKIKSLSVSTDDVIITGVKIEIDTKKFVLKGTDEYIINIKNNPLVSGKEEEIATYLFNKLSNLKFRPMTCSIVNNPLYEPCDLVYVYDKKGNGYFTLINSINYKISGFTTIACKAENPLKNKSSYISEAAKAAVTAKRKIDEELTIYDKSVQNMNMLAANAMGLYRESEKQSDGSEIHYQSNRPITKNSTGKCQFETGSVVYKMTGNGFFVSTDGGKSFTAGFDSNGNAILNVLSAIGITFDWARGGTLSLGGDNNIDGKAVVYDKFKNQLGSWDNMGFWTKSTDYKNEEEIQYYKQRINPGCGRLDKTVKFIIFGAEGAEKVTEKGYSLYNGTSEDKYFNTPTGYIDDLYPYWEISARAILSEVRLYEPKYILQTDDNGMITTVPYFKGYLKRIQCYEDEKLIYDRNLVKYIPAAGVYADLRNGFFHNKTWKIQDGNIYKNNILTGNTVLLLNTLSNYGLYNELEDDFYTFKKFTLLTQDSSTNAIVDIMTIDAEIFKTLEIGSTIKPSSEFCYLEFSGITDNIMEYDEENGEFITQKMITLKIISPKSKYYAKFYGTI